MFVVRATFEEERFRRPRHSMQYRLFKTMPPPAEPKLVLERSFHEPTE